ncbi:hypothetical protein [Sphingomonas paucimobilis]|uniref:hypothetical protein n=1 Tax=Sphingomonas paucimobilis TaxID=13689 RepID=UPI0031E0F1B4
MLDWKQLSELLMEANRELLGKDVATLYEEADAVTQAQMRIAAGAASGLAVTLSKGLRNVI